MNYITFKDGHKKEITHHTYLTANVFADTCIWLSTWDREQYLYKEWFEEYPVKQTIRNKLFPLRHKDHQFFIKVNDKWIPTDDIESITFKKYK